MKIKINNDYKCFMSIPNINFWYDYEGRKLFIGWLWWGIDLIFKGYDVEDADRVHSATMDSTFPKLKEDERIRKVLIDYFNRYKEQEECGVKTFYGIPTDNILAWLEKQGEKKSAWSEEDRDLMYDTLSNLTELKDLYGKNYGKVGKCIDWLKSLKERLKGK